MNIKLIDLATYQIDGISAPESAKWNRLTDLCDHTGQNAAQLITQFGRLVLDEQGQFTLIDRQYGLTKSPLISLVEYTRRLSQQPGSNPAKNSLTDWVERIFVEASWAQAVVIACEQQQVSQSAELKSLFDATVFNLNLETYSVNGYEENESNHRLDQDLTMLLKQKFSHLGVFHLQFDAGFKTLFVDLNRSEVTLIARDANYETQKTALKDNSWHGVASENEPGSAFFVRQFKWT